jgi:hypothetical protein
MAEAAGGQAEQAHDLVKGGLGWDPTPFDRWRQRGTLAAHDRLSGVQDADRDMPGSDIAPWAADLASLADVGLGRGVVEGRDTGLLARTLTLRANTLPLPRPARLAGDRCLGLFGCRHARYGLDPRLQFLTGD